MYLKPRLLMTPRDDSRLKNVYQNPLSKINRLIFYRFLTVYLVRPNIAFFIYNRYCIAQSYLKRLKCLYSRVPWSNNTIEGRGNLICCFLVQYISVCPYFVAKCCGFCKFLIMRLFTWYLSYVSISKFNNY